MSEDTVFHKIVRGEIPADVVFEDEQCLVFRDINPVAPVHLLCIPKQFVADLSSASEHEEVLLGHAVGVGLAPGLPQIIDTLARRFSATVNAPGSGGLTADQVRANWAALRALAEGHNLVFAEQGEAE